MASLSFLLPLFLSLYLFHLTAAVSSASSRPHPSLSDGVRSSCLQARYPKLCITTLASYSGPDNIQDIAQAAVRVSLARVRSVSEYLRTEVSGVEHRTRREQAALADCVTQVKNGNTQLSGDKIVI